MTFSTTEKSAESGEPIEFYTFTFGSQVFRYTNYDIDVTFQGFLYLSRQIQHSDVEVSGQQEINSIEIKLPSDDQVSQKYINIVPGKRGQVSIYKTHRSEVGGTEEAAVIFEGFIATAKYSRLFTCVLKCKPTTSIFNRPGPRFQYTGLCNHILYDSGCKVNSSLFKYTGTVTAVTGEFITVNGASGQGADYFVGGFAEFPPDLGDDFRLVLEQSGDVMRLLLPFGEDVLGQTVNLFAGCKHDNGTCDTKFSNILNYGGFPYIPRLNPFGSGLR